MEIQSTPSQQARVALFLKRHRLGLVTLLFTDIAGSTRLKQELGDTAAVLLIQQHHALLRETLKELPEGEEIETAGDSFFLVFTKPSDAVRFSLLFLKRMNELNAAGKYAVRDRIGIHVGEVFVQSLDESPRSKALFGIQVDTCARVMGLGAPGQILLTRFAADNSRQVLRGPGLEAHGKVHWLNHGLYEFKGVAEPLEICEVGETGIGVLAPPSDSEKAWRHKGTEELHRTGWRPAVGAIVPKTQWRLEEHLGEGGFGEVWRAVNPDNGEICAFKFSFRPEGINLLRLGWKAAEALQEASKGHDAAVRVFEAHVDAPPHYLRQEFVPGRDLAAWCGQSGGPLAVPIRQRAELLAQMTEAVAAIHRLSQVHGDLKPTNVLVVGDDPARLRVRLADFGAWTQEAVPGASSRSTAFNGSPLYLAPELTEGGTPNSLSADVYSLGAVGYELLTGRPPFLRPSLAALLEAHRHEEPRLPCLEQQEVPDALQRICLKALEKRPAERYASAAEMARDLRRFIAGEPVLVRPSQYDNAIASRVRRHLRELGEWRRERLLTDGEYAKLAGAYQGFDRSGLEAVLESRRIHGWLVALLLGGWLVIDASSIWLKTTWETLGAVEKIGVGWLPVVITNGLWVTLWRHGSLRGAHIMMLLGAISLPFGLEVLLHARHWLEITLFNPWLDVAPIYNAQLLVVLPLAIMWAVFLMNWTRTISVAVLAVVYTVLLYLLLLDFGNLHETKGAWLALRSLPLVAILFASGAALARPKASRRQSAPWFAAALLALFLTTLVLAWDGPNQWIAPGDRILLPPLRGFFLGCCGMTYLLFGLWLRRRFLVQARAAYLALLWLAPVTVLGGVAYLAVQWPDGWAAVNLFATEIPLPDLVLFVVSLICLGAAARLQLRFYVVTGLVFLTAAEWMIASYFFDDPRPVWAITLLVIGAAIVAMATARELRIRRERPWQEMDDTIDLPPRKTRGADSEITP